MADPSGWWWCFRHGRAESPPDVPGGERLGPYPTQLAAEEWRSAVEARNEKWDREDEEWAKRGH